jgi:hypothetical protein
MRAAQAAIQKAKTSSENQIKVTTTTIPTRRDDTKYQLYVEIPPVTVIDVIVPKGRRK